MRWDIVIPIGVFLLLFAAIFVFGRDKKSSAGADGQMTTEEISAVTRDMWDQAEQALRAYADARGDEVAPARERMLRIVDDVDANIETFGAQGASERQMAMWRLAAEEIREFVNEALAKHPEDQRR